MDIICIYCCCKLTKKSKKCCNFTLNTIFDCYVCPLDSLCLSCFAEHIRFHNNDVVLYNNLTENVELIKGEIKQKVRGGNNSFL